MKPLRGKRVGSAQSARRIQPGGASGRAGGFPGGSFFSRSPVRLPAPSGAGGRGRRGTAPRPALNGRRRAHFLRGGAPRPAPGRLGRPGGEGGSGGAGVTRGAGPTPPRVLQPPGSSARRIPGPRERPVAVLSPRLPLSWPASLPPPSPSPPRGGGSVRGAGGVRSGGRSGGPGGPSHGATALPPSPHALVRGQGGADCPQCAPGVVAPSGPGVLNPRSRRAHGVGGDVGYPPDPS